MPKYQFKSKEGGKIRYVYRTGFAVTVKPDYPKFLRDLMNYASVDVDDIETEQDLIDLFDKAKNKGADFGRSGDGEDAIKNQWQRSGRTFKKKDEDKQTFLNRDTKSLLKSKTERKIFRKEIVQRVGRGRKVVKYEEVRILFRIFDEKEK